jgi:hypothetical protein
MAEDTLLGCAGMILDFTIEYVILPISRRIRRLCGSRC